MTTPYEDSLDHLRDELRRLDLLLGRQFDVWWSEHDGEGTIDEFRGLYVSDEEVAELLQSTRKEAGHDGDECEDSRAFRDRLQRTTARIDERVRATRSTDTELRLETLASLFDLDRSAIDVLLVGLAPELNLRYERIYSYLNDDVTRKRPTVALTLDLLSVDTTDPLDMRAPFARSGPLLCHRLLHLAGEAKDASLLARTVRVDQRIIAFLLGDDEIDPRLIEVAELHEPKPAVERLNGRFDESTLNNIHRVLDNERSAMLFISGPYGSGRAAVAGEFSRDRGVPLLTVDAAAIPEGAGAFADVLDRTVREAKLQGATVRLVNTGERPEPERIAAVSTLDAYDGDVILSSETPWRPRRPPERHRPVELPLSVPDYAVRCRLWRYHLATGNVDGLLSDRSDPDDPSDLEHSIDPSDLAAKFQLTDGQIQDALATATTAADGSSLTRSVLYRACREQSAENLDALARRIEPNYDWADIVLPSDRLTQLQEIALRIRHRGTVYAEWGFEEKFSLGNGLVVLFAGPSGTGKTMAAEIIAGDAGLDLYKIDLSQMVSKYIGETEKNLRRVFDEAEHCDAILFFDEADALFGERSEVHDSHDRYANIEVNYLLQRIEEHDGVVLLTTNFRQNIDDAFMRRIHVTVDFLLPDQDSREAIWRGVFPSATPLGELDFPFLASFEVPGGTIKNVALTAAFLAADDGERVEMRHVVRAARREFQKTGKLTSPDEFGRYRDLLT
ncbi:ATP-binding protein [Halalkalicoccus salilacus]|uniref:ATP-binding protein n=1 Tax=Halalkalicoccus salilacus TaxID=3117459 RepID=UPI00300E7F73